MYFCESVSFVLAPKIAKNHAETLTPSTDSSQYSFVLEKDFEQYFWDVHSNLKA
jgi:hypothetical protein